MDPHRIQQAKLNLAQPIAQLTVLQALWLIEFIREATPEELAEAGLPPALIEALER